jgi:CheY-like chemotaxis protein
MLAYAGQGKSHIEPIVLTHVIRDLSHLLSPPAFKNAELVFELDEDLPAVEGDLGQIQQVILNLVTNACEALESNVGTVSVRTGVMDCDQEYLANTWLADALPSGEYVFLEISDYGIGMDDDMLKKIVDPFFTTKVTGRGMGLAAVLGIIRGHSGAIQIVSSPGEGSTFTVLLPVAGSEVPSEFAPVCSTAPEGAVTILVVDDEDTIRSVARRMLTRMDVTVVESCNGEEAVSIIAERGDEIACVLLDLSMPRMGGMEAVKKMRQLRQDLPVVLMSGYDKSEAIGRFSDVELQGFLQKPFHGDSLRDVLRSMMHLP